MTALEKVNKNCKHDPNVLIYTHCPNDYIKLAIRFCDTKCLVCPCKECWNQEVEND